MFNFFDLHIFPFLILNYYFVIYTLVLPIYTASNTASDVVTN